MWKGGVRTRATIHQLEIFSDGIGRYRHTYRAEMDNRGEGNPLGCKIQISRNPNTKVANYLGLYEEKLRRRSPRSKWIIGRKSLLAFNTFEVERGMRKMMVVPGITFGKGVTCLSSTTRNFLETRQREAGRMALGLTAQLKQSRGPGLVGL